MSPMRADAALGPGLGQYCRHVAKAVGLFVAVCAAFAVAACYPVTTSNPIGTSSGISADPALAGLWRAQMAHSAGEPVYFHFLPMQDGSFQVVIVSGGETVDGEWSVARITAATLGEHHFLNAELVFNNGKQDRDSARGTVPLLYRIEADGRISLFLIAEDAAKDAIQKGDIAGRIEPGDLGDVAITAEGDDLDAFLASKEGVALFSEKFATLTKMVQ